MSALGNVNQQMTRYRWVICAMLFFATTVNYLDRQVLSLLQPMLEEEFHWTDNDYGTITAIFSLFYAISMLFAGRFIDWMGTRKGYAWSIAVWSAGAALHALCGVLTEKWVGLPDADALRAVAAGTDLAATISMVSVTFFIIARCVLALGEAGNFPAAIKATAEYFPKKDRAFATGIFNSGANVGAIVAPLTVPLMAELWGWEMAFIIVGLIGFIWMGIWLFIYKPIADNPKVNDAERAYIQQDDAELTPDEIEPENESKLSFIECLGFKQTWAFAFGKFMTDGVWWFFLFWTPAYISDILNLPTTSGTAQMLIVALYLLTLLSIYGGKLPTIIMEKTGLNPYAARMRAMFIFALFPLLTIAAQPLGSVSVWWPVILIGIAGAAHQSWSANIYSVVGDMFPKNTIATIVGIGGLASGLGSFLVNLFAGMLFDYAAATGMSFMGFTGKPAGYFIVFCYCGIAYIAGWCVMKLLVPRYKIIDPSGQKMR